MPVIRYGVVGTSQITASMIEGASHCPNVKLTAVCSRDYGRGRQFADRMGADRVYTSPADMAADTSVDMVYIASPNRCHAEQCRLFLERGKHVLCEKPLMADPEELLRLQQLAEQKGLLFREAIMMLYQPQKEILRQAVERCGRVSMAHFDYCQLSSRYEAYCRGERPNIFNPYLQAGTLMDLGVYCVYPALWLFGAPQCVEASATFLDTGADGAGSALLIYPDKQVVLTYSKIGQSAAPTQIVGDAGTVTVESVSTLGQIAFHPPHGEIEILYGQDEKTVLMGREMDAFAKAIISGHWLDEESKTALAVCRCMAQIREAAGIRFPEEDIE